MEAINDKESKEKVEADLKITFSKESEAKRIQYTIDKLDWFKKQGYKINLPEKIKEIIDHGLTLSDDEILKIVSLEFNQKEYEDKANELRQKWEEKKGDFLHRLASLGLPLQSEYKLVFTKYGVGGSYGLPNIIQINFEYPIEKETIAITLHEIIHLTIEELIKKYGIDHWEKERLVDLIYGKFYPNEKRLQRDPEKSKEVERVFEAFYPDMEKVLSEIGTL